MIRSIHLLLFFCCGLSVTGYRPPPPPDCPESCAGQTEFDALRKRVEILEQKVKDNTDEIAELKRGGSGTDPIVAFSAVVARYGTVGPFKTDKVLTYRRVLSNLGNSFNRQKGIFTAPVQGVYYFTFFYHAGGNREAMVYLYRNYRLVVMSSDHISQQDGADNGGNAVVLHLQKGDQVYLCLAANTHVWGSYYHTTFSGFLVNKVH